MSQMYVTELNKLHYVLHVHTTYIPHRDGLVVNVSASHAVGRGLAPRSGHTKDYHKKWYKLHICLACNC